MEDHINLEEQSNASSGSACHIKASKEEVKPDGKRKSIYWEHFIDIVNPVTKKIEKVKCKYCSKILSANPNSGTSTLRKHLQSCSKYPQNVDKKQKKISLYRDPQTESVTLSNWAFDVEATRLALAKMVIIDEHSFSVVEKEGFRGFVSVACPQFVSYIPSRFTVARDCKKLYLCEKDTLKTTLKGLKSRIALTTDCWTSVQNLNYLCLTAHFIDDEWNLHKRILNFKLMDSHKGKEIGKVVESCVIDWGIEDKLSCITVDNASSNNVAVAYLKDNLGDKLVLDGNFFHMRCAAHVLNLVVRDGLSRVKDSIHNIRCAIRYIRSSPARSALFDTCAKVVKVPCKGSLCLDVCTRWNSTFLMLNTALKFERAFERFKNDDCNFENELKENVPMKKDWENAKDLAKFLEQFYEATKRMSGSLYVTANLHFHDLLSILTNLLEWERDPSPNLRDMAFQMHKKFDDYYGDWAKTNPMVLIAVVFYPRYKLKFVRFSFRKLYPNDFAKADRVYDHLYNGLKRLYDSYSSCVDVDKDDHNGSSPIHIDHSKMSLNNDTVKELYSQWHEGGEDDVEVLEKTELDVYLDAPREKVDGTFDILKWWKKHSDTYKVLAEMARDVLAVPVSTVSSESAFSTSGRVLDQFRSSLGPKTVETLICTQDWLRASTIYVDVEQLMDDMEKYEAVYPKVKVRATAVDDDYECSVIPLQDFSSFSIRDFSPEEERKHLSGAKVPRLYITRSITPPPWLPKAAKKSGQQTEDNVKSRTTASSIPRPRAVMSSPDNDQILGNGDKTRLERPSPLKNRNTAPCRPFSQSRSSPSAIIVKKPLKTAADSKETAHTSCNAREKKGSAVDIRVPRARIVKAKPCFTT